MICWIIVSDHRTQLFVGMRQHIIQSRIEAFMRVERFI